jgi:hypothetical protein
VACVLGRLGFPVLEVVQDETLVDVVIPESQLNITVAFAQLALCSPVFQTNDMMTVTVERQRWHL